MSAKEINKPWYHHGLQWRIKTICSFLYMTKWWELFIKNRKRRPKDNVRKQKQRDRKEQEAERQRKQQEAEKAAWNWRKWKTAKIWAWEALIWIRIKTEKIEAASKQRELELNAQSVRQKFDKEMEFQLKKMQLELQLQVRQSEPYFTCSKHQGNEAVIIPICALFKKNDPLW